MSATPITDSYIDSIIKANDTNDTDPGKTQGKDLRELFKAMRDRFQGSFQTLQPDAGGIVRVTGGVEQITVTAAIMLDVTDRTAGLSGTLFILQDSLGLHNVTLAPLNQGLSTPVATPPGTITKVTWENLPDFTAWVAELVIGADNVEPPVMISDLQINFVDSTIVQIQWSAPSGDAGKVIPAESYTVYVNNAPITNFDHISWLPVYRNALVPQEPGNKETLNLYNLLPKSTYYVAVVANKTTYGVLRTGAVTSSTVISFNTLPLTGGGLDSPDILIPIKPEQVSAYTTAYTKNSNGVRLDHTQLVDYSKITFTAGVPSGTGNLGMNMTHTDSFKGYYNQLQAVYFDLQGVYTLNKVWFILTKGGQDIVVEVSQDGTNWLTGGRTDPGVKGSFIGIDIASPQHVKFFRIYGDADGGNSALFSASVVVAAGKAESGVVAAGIKFNRGTASLSLKDRIGTNMLSMQDPIKGAKLSTFTRIYLNHAFFLPATNQNPLPNTQTTVTLDNIRYWFRNNSGINPDGSKIDFDLALRNFKNAGIEPLICLVSGPLFCAKPGTTTDSAKVRKPLDIGKDETNLMDTTNPQNYKFLAQFYGQIAARWGSGTPKDDSYYKVVPDQIQKSLGLVKYYEVGLNECDGASTSASRYTNAEELACLISACWDGHKGALGPGFGIKEADPTAKVCMAGLTGNQIGYVKAMFRWWDVNRGPGDYPIDAIQQHTYNTSVDGQGIYGQLDLYSLPPELGFYGDYVRDYINWRNSTPALNDMEFWIGEYGYDEHYGSAFSPNSLDAVTRGLLKGLYIIRFFLISDWLQVDRIIQYAYFGIGTIKNFSTVTQDIYHNFYTAGYLDGNSNTTVVDPPLAAYFYAVAFRKAIEGYVFAHACIIKGTAQTVETIADNHDPDLYCLAYVPANPSATSKSLLIIWLGGMYDRTVNMNVNVSADETQVNLIGFKDIHVTKSETGIASTVSSGVNGDIRSITLGVTATPTFIFTNRIGTSTLTAPKELSIQAASASSLILSWRDENTVHNHTRIYVSYDHGVTFNQLFDGYLSTGSYTHTGLTEYTSYTYRIDFEYNGLQSAESETRDGRTLKIFAVPSDLAASIHTVTSITITWKYTLTDLAFIEGFELWRSLSESGIYDQIATLPPNKTPVSSGSTLTSDQYVDNGLSPDTTYYYKVRAYNGLQYSDFTPVSNGKTDPTTTAVPTLISAESNYAGNRITLKFSIPMATPGDTSILFTLSELVSGNYVPHNFSSIVLDPADNTKLKLYFDGSITSSGNALKLSYSGGAIKTIYGTLADSFADRVVTNLYLSSSLLVKTMKINLTTAAYPSGLPDWTDVNLTQFLANQNLNMVTPVLDPNPPAGHQGAPDTIANFTFVQHYPESVFHAIVDISANPGNNISESDFLNAMFPVKVRVINAEIGVSGPIMALKFALMSIPPENIYNVTTTGWEYNTSAGFKLVITGNNGATASFTPALNKTEYARITNLKPAMIDLGIVPSGNSTDAYATPKITFTCTSQGGTKVGVCGFIIEECIDN